jgi:hypothetical protein
MTKLTLTFGIISALAILTAARAAHAPVLDLDSCHDTSIEFAEQRPTLRIPLKMQIQSSMNSRLVGETLNFMT